MGYKVRIPKIIKGVIALQCSRAVIVQVYAHLCGELTDHPERYRHRLVSGLNQTFRYRFSVTDPADPDHRHVCTLLIEDRPGPPGVFVPLSFKRTRRPL